MNSEVDIQTLFSITWVVSVQLSPAYGTDFEK
jgi:hypothetical protein